MTLPVVMDGVGEYAEGMPVQLRISNGYWEPDVPEKHRKGFGKIVVLAANDAGCNCTEVDLIQLLKWIKTNAPEILNSI